MLSVIMPNVVMHSVVIPSIFILKVIMHYAALLCWFKAEFLYTECHNPDEECRYA
jgi:hypothetical protein